jgi:hypothetical protein
MASVASIDLPERFLRVAGLSDASGCRGLLVHA